MCCARHSRQVVCGLRVPIPRARSHQRARAHRADVTREKLGETECAQTENIMLCGQPRRPRSGLKRPLVIKASQLRTPAACTRMSQCVSVNRPVVGAILGEPCRRAVARYLAGRLATFAPVMATSSSYSPVRVSSGCPRVEAASRILARDSRAEIGCLSSARGRNHSNAF